MSAYKKITCSFKDKDILMECLKELNYKPAVYEEKKPLHGWLGDSREECAEIIIPKNQISHISNDIGFSYDEEKKEYTMICSEFDLLHGYGDKITQLYAVTAIKSALKKNKFNITTESKNKTSIVINANKII